MQSNADSKNPYQSPVAVSSKKRGVVRQFHVGDQEPYTIAVESTIWRGICTQATDPAGELSPVHRGPCQFVVGESDRHEISIEVDKMARVNAYVDGELVGSNLFAKLRRNTVRGVVLFTVALFLIFVLLLLFAFYEIDKFIDPWIDAKF